MEENKRKVGPIIAVIILLLAAAGAGYYFYTSWSGSSPYTPPPPAASEEPTNFSRVGTLARNEPGTKADVWYLVAGTPAERFELVFTERSQCTLGELIGICVSTSLVLGAAVEVTGYEVNGTVRVHTLKQLDLEGKG